MPSMRPAGRDLGEVPNSTEGTLSVKHRPRTPTHSVVCISYNQRLYVEKAIRSLFAGRVWPDEVIVMDDCSTDGTAVIIERLRAEHPERIRVINNPVNLGLFANLNQIVGLPSGDFVHILACDDWYEPGMFEAMNEEVSRRELDPATLPFVLLPDAFMFDGVKLTCRSNGAGRIPSLFKSALRQNVFFMPVGMSQALFKHYPPFRTDLGLWADYLHQLLFVRYCEHVYRMNGSFAVYRLGSGVSSRASRAQLSESFLRVIEAVLLECRDDLDASDRRFLAYLKRKHFVVANPGIRSATQFALYFMLNVFNGVRMSHLEIVAGAVVRRWLPGRTPSRGVV